ncbi:MAG TPA: glycosyltransferase [Patescibacteria group bacterium]|nr:glycosyltransferase [Patescibacteria group bacterium]
MRSKTIKKTQKVVKDIINFFVPNSLDLDSKRFVFEDKKIVAIIPTYKPKDITYRLVRDLVVFHNNVKVVVIDDHTPSTALASQKILKKIRGLRNKNVTIIRTPDKKLKAAALNFGIDYIASSSLMPDAVITFDDDVVILQNTVYELIKILFSNKKMGVVCSRAWASNKNKNLLTRLQGLEYHGFTITRIADNGFLQGPLVMHGMLSAFRYDALMDVKGFAVDNLIEDYDITVRIKNAGWQAAMAPLALSWTEVPETLGDLWKQRIRWSYGGLIVVKDFWRKVTPVFQDLVGHAIFLSLFSLIVLSLIFTRHTPTPSWLVISLLAIATLQFLLSFTFSIIALLSYKDRDKVDWLLKLSLFPEFAYSNILSTILLGSYIFFAFNIFIHFAVKYMPLMLHLERTGKKSFQKIGYSVAWGTRN